MKTVFLIRHAKSSWSDSSLSDHDRPLNKRGFRDAPFMAKLLAGKENKPDAIISSTANRAKTTAGYFAEAFGIPVEEIVLTPEIYEAYTRDVLEIIQHLDNKLNVVLFFGHNPTFTSIANIFSQTYIPNLPTCGIVKIQAAINTWSEFNDTTAKQTAFYYPKQYFE